MARRRAFTLFELMIVLTIIVLLAAMLFPILHAAVEAGRRTTCMSNMRQLHAAYLQYSAANDGVLFPCDDPTKQAGAPRSDEAFDIPELRVFAGDSRIFHCPSDLERPGYRTYSINDFVGGAYGQFIRPFRRMSDVINAPSTFLWIEETTPVEKGGNTGGFVVYPYPGQVLVDQPAALHQNGTCITFVDGHCEFWKWLDSRTTTPITRQPPVPSKNNPDVLRLQRVEGTDNVPGG